MIKHNYIAIAVMIIAHMIIGAIWYGWLFSDLWAREALGKTVAEIQKQPVSYWPYVVNVIAAACNCFFISWLVQKLNITSFEGGVKLGLYTAVGFVFPSIAAHYIFLGIKDVVLAIDFGMTAVLSIITCACLAIWRKK